MQVDSTHMVSLVVAVGSTGASALINPVSVCLPLGVPFAYIFSQLRNAEDIGRSKWLLTKSSTYKPLIKRLIILSSNLKSDNSKGSNKTPNLVKLKHNFFKNNSGNNKTDYLTKYYPIGHHHRRKKHTLVRNFDFAHMKLL